MRRPPAYRQRVVRGKKVALVTLADSVTKKRKDFWLGAYGTRESREQYARLLAEWEAAGRRIPDPCPREPASPPSATITVADVVLRFWQHAKTEYSSEELHNLKLAGRVLVEFYGSSPAHGFGPLSLRRVRDAMVAGNPDAVPPRRGWSRPYVNRQVKRIVMMFGWAASWELLPASVVQSLRALKSLKRGRTAAPEQRVIHPADETAIEATKRHASRQVAAMIDMQLLTGMRPAEVCRMRPADVNRSGPVWVYSPQHHKTAHLERVRTILIGPKAQCILRPFLENRTPESYVFSPEEAELEHRLQRSVTRRTPRSCGNRPGTNRVQSPRRRPQDRYTRDSYRRAVDRACERADREAKTAAGLLPEPKCPVCGRLLPAWGYVLRHARIRHGVALKSPKRTPRLIERWNPRQLRKNYATRVRRDYGVEAASILLGHSSAELTDRVYAERDLVKALQIQSVIG